MLTRSVSFLQQVISGVKLFFLYFSLFLRIFDSVAGGICCSSAIAFFSLWGLASTPSISLIFLLSEIDSLGFESAILTGVVWQRSEAGFPFPIPAIKKGKEGAYRHLPKLLRKIHAVRESPCNANEWKRNIMLLEKFCFYVPVVQNFPATSGVKSKFPERVKFGFFVEILSVRWAPLQETDWRRSRCWKVKFSKPTRLSYIRANVLDGTRNWRSYKGGFLQARFLYPSLRKS